MAKFLASSLSQKTKYLAALNQSFGGLGRVEKVFFSTLKPRSPLVSQSAASSTLANFFGSSPSGVSFVPNSNLNGVSATPGAQLSAVPTFPCVKSAVKHLYKAHAESNKERAFFVNDIGVVQRQYSRWVNELPNVRPFYAVKCNPDEMLLNVLANEGAGFDCASGAEMEAALAQGMHPDEIIFANPIKNIKDLRFARKHGVKKMTFDNEDELHKIKAHCPEAELVLRLLPDDSGSVMRFGVKFGAPNAHVESLLRTATMLDLKVIGTSFHIGSGCFDPESYRKAIALCRETFDLAEKLKMPRFTFLDLGGGFPGVTLEKSQVGESEVPTFEAFAAVIRSALHEYFPAKDNKHVQVIAEPGRYMATSWSTLFTLVQGKRQEPADPLNPEAPRKFLYYINDGVYGAFNCMMFDHAHPEPVPSHRFMRDRLSLEQVNEFTYAVESNSVYASMLSSVMSPSRIAARALHSDSQLEKSLATFFGPTCDSMDVIAKETPMEELFVGEWVGFEAMGAYTNAAATTFNGMPKAATYYCRSMEASPLL